MAEGERDPQRRKPGDGELDLGAKYDADRTGCFPWFHTELGEFAESREQEWKSLKEPPPHPNGRTFLQAPPWLRRSEQMLLSRQALSLGGVTCGGWRRGRKSSRYRSRRGMFLFLKLLGVGSCLDSLCFGWSCPIMAKSMGLGASLPGLNLSS